MKKEIIKALSYEKDIIFTGGTASYLKGYKKELNDLDILTTDINVIKKSFPNIELRKDKIPYPNTKNRYRYVHLGIVLDIWELEKPIEYIQIGDYKVTTIKQNIDLLEYLLKVDIFNHKEEKEKFIKTLEKFYKWQNLEKEV